MTRAENYEHYDIFMIPNDDIPHIRNSLGINTNRLDDTYQQLIHLLQFALTSKYLVLKDVIYGRIAEFHRRFSSFSSSDKCHDERAEFNAILQNYSQFLKRMNQENIAKFITLVSPLELNLNAAKTLTIPVEKILKAPIQALVLELVNPLAPWESVQAAMNALQQQRQQLLIQAYAAQRS